MSVMYIRDKDGNLIPVKTIRGKQGEPGKDYVLTEADKAEIAGKVIEILGGNPVFGYIDENMRIVLSGYIPDGTYTAAFEMDDGTVVPLTGQLVKDTNVYCKVTNALTNCTNSNSATQAVQGESYSAIISADSGYELSSVKVTMGGTDISSTAVSGGTISIANVTGNIVITAVAEEIKAAEPVTVDIVLTDGIRIGVSDGSDRTQAGCCATPDIDLTNIPKPCTINLTGAKWCNVSATDYVGTVCTYAKNADGSKLVGSYTSEGMADAYFTVVKNGGSLQDITVTVISDEVASIRFSGIWTDVDSNSMAAAGTKATLTYTPET